MTTLPPREEAVQYRAEDIAPDMLDAHLVAIEAGQKVREGLLSMLKDILDEKRAFMAIV